MINSEITERVDTMNPLKMIVMLMAIPTLTGCLSLGSSEFSCPGIDKGATCMSAREVYDATENRNNLEETSDTKKSESVDSEETVVDFKRWSTQELEANLKYYRDRVVSEPTEENITAYIQLQDLVEYRKEKLESEKNQGTAPEAQAMRSQSSNMRIWVSPWKDGSGDLNLSGYIYTEVEQRQWLIGERAVAEPSRIVPLQVVRRKEKGSEKNAAKNAARMGSNANPLMPMGSNR